MLEEEATASIKRKEQEVDGSDESQASEIEMTEVTCLLPAKHLMNWPHARVNRWRSADRQDEMCERTTEAENGHSPGEGEQ